MAIQTTIEVLRIPGTLFPRGPFDENASYKFLNFVESGGSGYVCLQPCTGIPVTNTAYWFKFVHKGDPGTPFTYADLTAEQKAELVRDATAAAQAAASSAQSAADDAAAALQKFNTIKAAIDAIDPTSTEGSIQTLAAKQGLLEADLADLRREISYVTEDDVTDEMVMSKYIITGSVAVGSVVDVENPTSNGAYAYIILPVSIGDEIKVKGKGGGNPRLWALLDNEHKLISKSVTDLATNEYITLIAESDGYLVVNTEKTNTTYPRGVVQVFRKSMKEKIAEVEAGMAENAAAITELEAAEKTLEASIGKDAIFLPVAPSLTIGAIDGDTGAEASTSNFYRTGYIDVGVRKYVHTSFFRYTTAVVFGYAFYDESHNVVSSKRASGSSSLQNPELLFISLEIPEGARYFRTTIYIGFKDEYKCYLSDAQSLSDSVESMKSAAEWVEQNRYEAKDLKPSFTTGYYINTNVAAGNVVDITPVRSAAFAHLILPCVAGDILDIDAVGGEAPRAFALLDTDYRLIEKSGASARYTKERYSVPIDGYIVVNANIQSSFAMVQYVNSMDAIKESVAGVEADMANLSETIEKADDYDGISPASVIAYKFKAGTRYRLTNRGQLFVFSIRQTADSTGYNQITANAGRSYEFEAAIDANYIRVGASAAPVSFTIEKLDTLVEMVKAVADKMPKFLYQFGKACDCRYTVPDIPALRMTAPRLDFFYTLFDALVDAHPSYVEKVDCDAECVAAGIERPSYMEDCPIYMYRFIPSYTPNSSIISNHNTAASRLKVYIVGGTHPEYMGIWDLYHTMRLICEQWGEDDNLDELRWNCEFYVIPCSGAWGVQNASRTNYNGVDLNRNAPASNWAKTTEGTNTWSGNEPASEYETKVMVHYMEQIRPNIFIDHHNTNCGSGSDAGDNKNMMYITCKFQVGVDIGAAHISQMSRAWKIRFTGIFPSIAQDPITMYGFAQITRETGTRGWYGCDMGALGFTYESNQSCLYQNGEYSTDNRTTNTTEISTMATDGFVNFLLRCLKTYSEYYRG